MTPSDSERLAVIEQRLVEFNGDIREIKDFLPAFEARSQERHEDARLEGTRQNEAVHERINSVYSRLGAGLLAVLMAIFVATIGTFGTVAAAVAIMLIGAALP